MNFFENFAEKPKQNVHNLQATTSAVPAGLRTICSILSAISVPAVPRTICDAF